MDATFVEVPKLCPSREEHAPIKVGERPTGWKVNQARQQDVNARWAKKHEETHYSYQNPVKADEANQLRQDYVVTPAAVPDSQVLDQLLDHTPPADGTKRPVVASSAYHSPEREKALAVVKLPSKLCETGSRGHPLTAEPKKNNRDKSKVRARVEHLFGAPNQMGGPCVRTLGIARAKTQVGMMNLVYNITRLVQLTSA